MPKNKYSSIGDNNLKVLDKSGNFTDWLYRQLKPYISGRILEIGSGTGTYSKKIISDFPENTIFLTDIDQKYLTNLSIQFKDKNIATAYLDLNSKNDFLKIQDKFDTIIAINVLEHIEKDTDALENLRKMLTVDGRLILLVPANKKMFNRIDEGVGHFRRYDKNDLVDLAIKTGYKVEELFSFNFPAIFGWYINGNILKKAEINEKAMGLYDHMVPVFDVFEKYILRKTLGISLIVVLKKR